MFSGGGGKSKVPGLVERKPLLYECEYHMIRIPGINTVALRAVSTAVPGMFRYLNI